MAFETYQSKPVEKANFDFNFLAKNRKLFESLDKLLKDLNMTDDFRIKTMEKVIRRVILGEY